MARGGLSGARVALYARYSTDRQREASIEDQLRRCRSFVEGEGGAVAEDLVFTDYAVSGASLARSGIEALLRAVDGGRVDVIVTEELSRISRDIADAADVFRKLQYADVGLIGVGDHTDTRRDGSKIDFMIRSLSADMDRERIRDRTRRGLEGRHLAGLSTGGLPYGYRSKPVEGPNGPVGHRILVDDGEALVVRRIFERYLAGASQAQIARELNADGVATPRSGKRRRKGWTSSTVRGFLRQEKYSGVWTFGKLEWRTEPGTGKRRPRKRAASEVLRQERPELRIVDAETWASVQARAAKVASKYSGRGSRHDGRRTTYPLSGLLECGSCGAAMVIIGASGRQRYRCNDNRTRGTCGNRLSALESAVRSALLGSLRARLLRPAALDYLRERIAERLGDVTRAANTELRAHRDRLHRTEARIAGLVSFLADGERSEYVVSALRDLEHQAKLEKTAIERLRASAAEPVRLPAPGELADRLLDLEALVKRDPTTAREALRRLFVDGTIRMVPDGERYVLRAGFLPLALSAAGAPGLARAPVNGGGCGGPIPSLFTAYRWDVEAEVAS